MRSPISAESAAGETASAAVMVRPVTGRRDFQTFFALPRRLHGSDPNWISPLDQERARQWSPDHPWFQHGRARAWLAWRDGRPVGSISAQVDELHQQTHGQAVGYFGGLEWEDDDQVLQALLSRASQWLAEEHMAVMRGPFDLSINQSCGLLVDGVDTPPMMLMGHHPGRYAEAIERAGLTRAMDTLAYIVPPDFPAPEAMTRLLARNRKRLQVRKIRAGNFEADLDILMELFNDAWSENWGFVPFTEAEFRAMGKELRQIIRPEYIQIAELDGEPAAFIVALPNINELIRDLNGRLLPLGWVKLLYRLKARKATTARVPLMGVAKKYQRGRMGSLLAFAVIDAVRWHLYNDGIRQVEMSWILETNTGMNRIIESLGGRCYKRYRIYEQSLGGANS